MHVTIINGRVVNLKESKEYPGGIGGREEREEVMPLHCNFKNKIKTHKGWCVRNLHSSNCPQEESRQRIHAISDSSACGGVGVSHVAGKYLGNRSRELQRKNEKAQRTRKNICGLCSTAERERERGRRREKGRRRGKGGNYAFLN